MDTNTSLNLSPVCDLTERDKVQINKLVTETNATYETVLSAYLHRNKDADLAYLMIIDSFNAGSSHYEK